MSSLVAWVWVDGKLVDRRELGSGVITEVGVQRLAEDWNASPGAQTLKVANYHDTGTGTAAASVNDVALQSPAGLARVAGAQTNPEPGVYRSYAVITYASVLAITEWGLFTAPTGPTLFDRKSFGVQTTAPGMQIGWDYRLRVLSGG